MHVFGSYVISLHMCQLVCLTDNCSFRMPVSNACFKWFASQQQFTLANIIFHCDIKILEFGNMSTEIQLRISRFLKDKDMAFLCVL